MTQISRPDTLIGTGYFSLSKKSPERVAFLCMIWYNKKGDENAAKGKKGKKSA